MDEAPIADKPDWSLFDDPLRLSFVESIDEEEARTSPSLDRITRLAAHVAGVRFAQVSLIGASQFVPSAHGCTYDDGQQHSPIPDSLCSVTMAYGDTLGIEDARTHPWVQDLPPVTTGAVGCYLGVPLRDVEGRPIGALCAFDQDQRSWDPAALHALEDLAALVTRELHLLAALETSAANEIRLRKVVAEIVDRPGLGHLTPLRAGARYLVPAGAPGGGDWVDFIEIDDSRVAFSIGDVVGHGLEAVVVMDELRHALRAYAFDSLDPAEALHRAGRLLAGVRPDSMATALHGEYDGATHTISIASAGHPPPVLLRKGRAGLVEVTPSPPLGCGDVKPLITTFRFDPGDRLVLVTDGVVERRTEPIDVGLARLVAIVESIGAGPSPAATADAVLTELVELVDGDLGDDACILVIDCRDDIA